MDTPHFRHRTLGLLELARDVAVERAVQAATSSGNGGLGHNSLRVNPERATAALPQPLPTPLENFLSEAWFYEETLQLSCSMALITGMPLPQDGAPWRCWQGVSFHLLAQLRQKHRQARADEEPVAAAVSVAAAAVAAKSAGKQEPVPALRSEDVLVILSDKENRAGLRSMLAGRTCPLRLHLLRSSARVPTPDWAEEVLAEGRWLLTPSLLGLEILRHHPWAVAGRLRPFMVPRFCRGKRCRGRGGGTGARGACVGCASACGVDLAYARLAPHLWLPQSVQLLAVVDLSRPERGPIFTGDICELPREARRARSGGAGGDDKSDDSIRSGALSGGDVLAYAPQHLELARWGVRDFVTDLMLLDLSAFRRLTISQLFANVSRSIVKSALEDEQGCVDDSSGADSTADDVNVTSSQSVPPLQTAPASAGETELSPNRAATARIFLHAWLHHFGNMRSPLVFLLPSSWWFVPFEPWLVDLHWESLMREHWLRDAWLRVGSHREYAGFDGTRVWVHCPHQAHYIPVALYNGFSSDFSELYAKGFERFNHDCGKLVHVMALQWERANEVPRFPFPIADMPWVRSLVAKYTYV
eukprot:TRINITY_DN74441_c0_g1_i1.p1 TRINITY_DN74441_c0_g1~~TRINITY_DN74441_c0_g1_i1.p1  ORF type:complete len:646 (-),score=109.19 TRINITY_DN74441_c0_g1_i1:12-1772(-)